MTDNTTGLEVSRIVFERVAEQEEQGNFDRVISKHEAGELLKKAKEEKAKHRKTKRQKRTELEQRFISAVIAAADYDGDIREMAAGFGVTWRNFVDRRHRVMWRALEALNLRSVDERMDILTEEAYAAVNQDPITVALEEDKVRGMPGSAAARQFQERLMEESKGLPWLERELEAADALRLIGGKLYLREIAKIAEGELLSVKSLAEMMLGKNS